MTLWPGILCLLGAAWCAYGVRRNWGYIDAFLPLVGFYVLGAAGLIMVHL